MQTYANYEYGRREPDLETTTKLAKLFNVSTDYLLGRDPKEDDLKTADLADDDTIFTYKGQPLSDDDKEIIRRLMNGK
ncbi:transcriptional regulator [Lactobacillus phage JNU_P1]|nr:transcriptional regulator [Lactobacillus phage JNU_P1]